MTYVPEYDESRYPCSEHGTIWHTGECAECDQAYASWVDSGRARLAWLAAHMCSHDAPREDCPVCSVDLDVRADDIKRGDQR